MYKDKSMLEIDMDLHIFKNMEVPYAYIQIHRVMKRTSHVEMKSIPCHEKTSYSYT